MKKDFSQAFKQLPDRYYLLIQDSVSGKFFVCSPDIPEEDDFYSVPMFEPDNKKTKFSRQLARFLYTSYGYSLIRFRELLTETQVAYSFIDSTSGSENNDICLHVVADIPDKTKQVLDGEVRQFVDLPELLDYIMLSPYYSPVAGEGIAQLINEANVLSFTQTTATKIKDRIDTIKQRVELLQIELESLEFDKKEIESDLGIKKDS